MLHAMGALILRGPFVCTKAWLSCGSLSTTKSLPWCMLRKRLTHGGLAHLWSIGARGRFLAGKDLTDARRLSKQTQGETCGISDFPEVDLRKMARVSRLSQRGRRLGICGSIVVFRAEGR